MDRGVVGEAEEGDELVPIALMLVNVHGAHRQEGRVEPFGNSVGPRVISGNEDLLRVNGLPKELSGSRDKSRATVGENFVRATMTANDSNYKLVDRSLGLQIG